MFLAQIKFGCHRADLSVWEFLEINLPPATIVITWAMRIQKHHSDLLPTSEIVDEITSLFSPPDDILAILWQFIHSVIYHPSLKLVSTIFSVILCVSAMSIIMCICTFVPRHFPCSSSYLSLLLFWPLYRISIIIPGLVAIDHILIFPIILVANTNNKSYCSYEHMIILISNYLLFY